MRHTRAIFSCFIGQFSFPEPHYGVVPSCFIVLIIPQQPNSARISGMSWWLAYEVSKDEGGGKVLLLSASHKLHCSSRTGVSAWVLQRYTGSHARSTEYAILN